MKIKKRGKTATMSRPGSAKLIEDMRQLTDGQKSIVQYIYGNLTPAQGTELGL